MGFKLEEPVQNWYRIKTCCVCDWNVLHKSLCSNSFLDVSAGTDGKMNSLNIWKRYDGIFFGYLVEFSTFEDNTDTEFERQLHHQWLQLGPNTNSNSILYDTFSPKTAGIASTATGASIKRVVSFNGDDSKSAASHKVSYELHASFLPSGESSV
ncbi:hypothetical protein CDAR_591241 [Caerostris darwini]|uniref:Uncharacterized protein n=1 Tax=Caerostris darwini TaxID=1538125 RepID=A0AAV4RQM9_9ARAC|nr:hypothetical protein CDAR_591241 [Caerostris darwini]